jgi:hypothetical protein
LTEEENTNPIEKRLLDFFPKLIDIIKDILPLAILGSLCVAIASFTKSSYPDSSDWAISAATMYLTAFAFSFLYKLTKNYLYAFLTYISIFFGTIFIIMIIFIFSSSITIVNTSYYIIFNSIYILFLSVFLYNIKERSAKRKDKLLYFLLFVIDIILTTSLLLIYSINIFIKILLIPVSNDYSNISSSLYVFWLAITLIIFVIEYYIKKKIVK